jgi:hypothetical protein
MGLEPSLWPPFARIQAFGRVMGQYGLESPLPDHFTQGVSSRATPS